MLSRIEETCIRAIKCYLKMFELNPSCHWIATVCETPCEFHCALIMQYIYVVCCNLPWLLANQIFYAACVAQSTKKYVFISAESWVEVKLNKVACHNGSRCHQQTRIFYRTKSIRWNCRKNMYILRRFKYSSFMRCKWDFKVTIVQLSNFMRNLKSCVL